MKSVSGFALTAAIFLCLAVTAPRPSQAQDYDFSLGCGIVGAALGAAAGAGVGTAGYIVAARIWDAARFARDTMIAAGAGGGGYAGGDVGGSACNRALNDYISIWEQQDYSYDRYLDEMCRGNALFCPDPLLNPSCGMLEVCDGWPRPPTDPWGCGTFGHCLPWLLDLGKQTTTVQDIINAVYFLDYALAAGSWDPTIGVTIPE